MKKLAVSLLLIATAIINVACASENSRIKDSKMIETDQVPIITRAESEDVRLEDNSTEKGTKMIKMPIQINSDGIDELRYLELKEDSTIQEKIDIMIKTISEECFSGLPLKVTIYNDNRADVELVELDPANESRITWKDEYLNDKSKESTINIIVKNLLQDDYKGAWIDKVKLYYNEELITLD
ncbi:hypothetical protein CHL78_002945 [Romboutsia weinsteinii]|uniref:Lipoprotein n=1 Tax=Romboutsia weinsteinii TaxID=2020949 RepID=A0A371J842_9FIRM|nr:hypothetical protein [Romboutsia weinsteinii]RDY28895.1 hypothetical protein CHL78_002945 [Romboutsia weinsteinii]